MDHPKRSLAAGAALALALTVAAGPAAAEGQTPPPAPPPAAAKPAPIRFEDWGLVCRVPPTGGEERCFIEQSQMLKDGDKRVLDVVIGTFGPEGELTMVATFPLGINLTVGAAFRIDDQPPQPIRIQQCVPVGCLGTIRLDDATLDRLRHAHHLAFAVMPFGADKTVAITASLKGFGPALDALKR
ncbi:invasion associated locus B family protein [Phaeospirillum tilakii]|uniref:Invasion associated locus B family protein n=1 Tax=Phaeospirillum tilakii TaxID=741673 RepID=A0ABW5C9T8_9PROT